MVPNLTPTAFVILMVEVLIFIFLMFFPTILELKRSKDSGPRKIMDDIEIIPQLQLRQIISLANIEEEKLGLNLRVIKKVAEAIAFLPNLEA